jgi:selenocysteine lyase/cysteine desulfurase
LLELKAFLLSELLPLGFQVLGPVKGPNASGITTVWHPRRTASALFQALEAGGVVASLRHDRSGREYLRFSPHFYNTEAELLRAVAVLRGALGTS